MIVKEHKTDAGIILSLCDEDVIGKKYHEGEMMLDLSSEFYKGEKFSIEEAKEKFKSAYIINAAGKDSVNLLKEKDLITEKNIIIIEGVPFCQCLIIENEK